MRNSAPEIVNIEPITANTVMPRSVFSSGLITLSWSSEPASSAMIAVAVSLTTFSVSVMSWLTKPNTNSPAITPEIR